MATYNFQQKPDGVVRVTLNEVFDKNYALNSTVEYVNESYFDVIESGVRTHYYAGNDFAINSVPIKGNGVTTVGSMQDIVNSLAAVFPNTNGSGAVDLSGITTDVVITDGSKGLVLKSPNGTQHRLSVNNDGSLSTTAL